MLRSSISAAFFASILVMAGCASSDQIRLVANEGQQAITRDGIPTLVSQKRHVVMLRPNSRLVKSASRPAFTIVVRNQGDGPEDLHETSISASRTVDHGRPVSLRVYKYDELVQEEESRQAVAAFGVALAGAGRAFSAANAGYTTTTGSVYGNSYGSVGNTPFRSSGFGTYTATTYDPLRAQVAQDLAQAQTSADFAAVRAQGEQNLASLQSTILKDHTLLPGEWHGGTIVLDCPEKSETGSARYTISLNFGGEMHEFNVEQHRM